MRIGAHCRCDDRLNSSSIRRWHLASGVARQVFDHRWGRSVTPTTTPWPRASSPPSRPLSHANGCLTLPKLLLTVAPGGHWQVVLMASHKVKLSNDRGPDTKSRHAARISSVVMPPKNFSSMARLLRSSTSASLRSASSSNNESGARCSAKSMSVFRVMRKPAARFCELRFRAWSISTRFITLAAMA